jgi:cytoskeletal protein CcmA (bactofilin family)
MAQGRTVSRRGDEPAVLGASARVRGRVSGDGDLVIEGRVEGDVVLRGELTVAEGGVLEGERIEAQSVRVDGTVLGGIVASGTVHLGPRARVRGDLSGAGISVDEGAEFEGRIDQDFELPAELGGGTGGKRR